VSQQVAEIGCDDVLSTKGSYRRQQEPQSGIFKNNPGAVDAAQSDERQRPLLRQIRAKFLEFV